MTQLCFQVVCPQGASAVIRGFNGFEGMFTGANERAIFLAPPPLRLYLGLRFYEHLW